MNKDEALEILTRHNINYSQQFLEFAVRFNSKQLLEEFCNYWKTKPAGGRDLNNFMLDNYKGKLGDN
jgi:hypothetical protein